MIDYDLTKIKGFAFDVDGVLSTNNVVMVSGENFPRSANIKDGYVLQLAAKYGFHLAIITGGRSEAVRARYEALGVQDLYLGSSMKIHQFREWMELRGLKPEEVLYMGDDIPDYEVMQACGCPCAPKDAAPEIRQLARYVSDKTGGNGCVRDVIEQVLKAQGKWMSDKTAFGW